MNSATEWIIYLVRPGRILFFASLISFGLIAVLSHWHKAWLAPQAEDWLSHQDGFTKFVIYSACWIVAYLVVLIIVARVASWIHYAIDSSYTTERAQKRRVKQLKNGDRIRVADFKGEDGGTVTQAEPTGEHFHVTWDDDGRTSTLCYFDVDIIELVK
jgi:hypothetical protein